MKNIDKVQCVNGHAFTPENTKLRSRASGGRECRTCCNARQRNLKRQRSRVYPPQYSANAKTKRHDDRLRVIAAYGGHCLRCGEVDIVVLDIDHAGGDGKEHRKSVPASALIRWLIRHGFPDGFQILCANCHRRKTAEEKGWYQNI